MDAGTSPVPRCKDHTQCQGTKLPPEHRARGKTFVPYAVAVGAPHPANVRIAAAPDALSRESAAPEVATSGEWDLHSKTASQPWLPLLAHRGRALRSGSIL